MHKKITGAAVAIAAVGGIGGIATAHGATAGGSRLDDGGQLLGQARITERQAVAAAQGAARGELNEVDLEQFSGRLVFTVDVGASDVRVDAGSGEVLDVSQDD